MVVTVMGMRMVAATVGAVVLSRWWVGWGLGWWVSRGGARVMTGESQSDGVPIAVPRMGCMGAGGVGRRSVLPLLLSAQCVSTRWGLVAMVIGMVRWSVGDAVL